MRSIVKWPLRGTRMALDGTVRKTVAAGVASVLLLTCPCASQASAVNSNRVDVTLQATVLQSLTLLVANPAIAFGAVTPGTTNAAPLGQAVAITTSWNLTAGATVKLYAYFDSASTAMTGALLGDIVPTSSMVATFNGGSNLSFNQASPFTSGSTALQLYSVPITSGNTLMVARVDNLGLSLNLAGVSLRPDTYAGVMHLQAQVL